MTEVNAVGSFRSCCGKSQGDKSWGWVRGVHSLFFPPACPARGHLHPGGFRPSPFPSPAAPGRRRGVRGGGTARAFGGIVMVTSLAKQMAPLGDDDDDGDGHPDSSGHFETEVGGERLTLGIQKPPLPGEPHTLPAPGRASPPGHMLLQPVR